MKLVTSVQLDTRKLDRLTGELERRADGVLNKGAINIQARAVVNTVRVDTSAMKNGWRIARIGRLLWVIYNTQDYAIFHELGTYKMSASPMLVPAVEAERRDLVRAWARLLELA